MLQLHLEAHMKKAWKGFVTWLKHDLLEDGAIAAVLLGLCSLVIAGLLSLEAQHSWRPAFAAVAGLVAIGVGLTMSAVHWLLFASLPALWREISLWPQTYLQLKREGSQRS
jgi:hypothetical protein